jgi:molybdate transport system substrate-binding protein
MPLTSRILLGLCLTGLFPVACGAGEIRVAVASNFTAPMHVIAAAFEKESGHKIVAAFGPSGKFYAQIRNGAPFQILFSADDEIPRRLEQEGLAVPTTRFTYAIGALALWSAQPGFVDRDGATLGMGRFSRLAIANPRLAPYGRAAVETLRNMRLERELEARLVQGENIAQTYQFVATGNAELGFVALSQIVHAGDALPGSAWIVPAALHSPIRQDAVLLRNGADNGAALELLRFFKTGTAQSIILSYGYRSEAN